MAKTPAPKTLKSIHKGLAIYKTDRSPYWYARVWNPVDKKYVVRSTKETSRIVADDAAIEFHASLVASKFKNLTSKAPASFQTFSDMRQNVNP